MTFKVTGCGDCPFVYQDNEYGSMCGFPNTKVDDDDVDQNKDDCLPHNCPLRFSGTVLVELQKVNEVESAIEFSDWVNQKIKKPPTN